MTVVLVYAVLASLWILVSDKALEWLFDISSSATIASVVKGWVFVVLTSVLLYGLLLRFPVLMDAPGIPAAGKRPWSRPFVVLIVIVAGLAALAIVFTVDDSLDDEEARLLAIADLKSRLIADWLAERRSDSEILRGTPLFAELFHLWRQQDDTGAGRQLLDLLSEYQKHYGYSDVLLIDGASANALDSAGDRVRAEPVVLGGAEKARDEGDVVRLGPYRSASGRVFVDFVVPLPDIGTGRRPVAVLRVDALDHLDPLLKSWPVSSATGESLLYCPDADELLLLYPRHASDSTTGHSEPATPPGPLSAEIVRDPHNHGRLLFGVDYRNHSVLATVLPITNTDWYLITKVDRREAYGRLLTSAVWIVLVALLALGTAWVTMRLAWNRQALVQATRDRARDVQLRQMSRLARIGAWELDPATGRGSWTEEAARIYEVPPERETSLEFGLSFFEGESRRRIEDAIDRAIAHGTAFDLELELTTARGNHKWVRTIGLPALHDDKVVRLPGTIQDITEQKQADLLLERERGLLKTLIQTLPDLIWLKDPEGRYITCNPRFEQFFGASETEIAGKTDYDFVDRELADSFREKDEAVVAGGRPSVNQEVIPFADGHRERVETIKTPMYDAQGQLIGVLGIARDITALHDAQESLKKARDRNQRYLDTAQHMMVAVDTEGRITMLNRAGCELLGYAADELLGRDWFATCLPQPEGIEEVYPVFQAILSGGSKGKEFEYYENPVLCRSGSQRLIAWHSAIMRDDAGQPIGVLASGEDVTERRAVEDQLRKLSRAVEQSFESIVITDLDGNIEYVNEAFVRNTGYSREEVIGENPRILQSGKTPSETYTEMWAALTAGRPWKGTLFNRRRDGSEYAEFAIISPIRQEGGQITHYVAAKEDITEKLRNAEELDRYRNHLEELVVERTTELAAARERADAANQAKSAFLANMSHEIRTPMNGVVGLLDVLERSRLDARQADLVATIRQSAGVLLGIIDDILDFSKIESGRMAIERGPVSLADLVQGVGGSLAAVASNKDVNLYLFVDPGVPRVLSDELRLRQILYNLIGNAIKFTAGQVDRQGRIWVSVEPLETEPLRLRFSVEDNGIGMAPETVDVLFSAFTQAEVSTTRRFGGTGLGLAICERVVNLLGGEIAVESELGEGSRFTVTLPFEPASEQPVEQDPDLQDVHCVLIETDRREADGIQRYLQHAGARVTRTRTLDALKLMATARSDLSLVICSADFDDSAAATGLKALPDDVPVLLITRGRRRGPCGDDPDVIHLDGNGMSRQGLLRSVAVAVGRASPEVARPPGESLPGDEAIAAPSVTEARAQGRLILVAEDDAINQKVVLQQLDTLGFAAEVAHNGVEALDLWRDGGYALLLTDLHMPEMDGYQLTAAIRREERHGRLPIVALTANALRGESQRATAAGMDAYLTKPVQLTLLRQTLERLLPAAPHSIGETVSSGTVRPGSAESSEAIDLNVLKGLVGDDPEIIHELLVNYRASARDYAIALHEASAAGNIAEISAVAHKLKSASRSVGAMALGDLCASLENAAKSGDTDALERELFEFSSLFTYVYDEIEHQVGGD